MIPADKAKASRVNCQGPLTKHLQAFHTPETRSALEMGFLMKKTVQGGHKAMAASGPQVITSADAISVLFFYSFH